MVYTTEVTDYFNNTARLMEKNETNLYIVNGVAKIDPDQLIKCFDGTGPKIVTFDRDGTLTDYRSPDLSEEVLGLLSALAKRGIMLGVNSNAGSKTTSRDVHKLGESIEEKIGHPVFVSTPFDAGGKKPSTATFEHLAKISGTQSSNTIHIGDQAFKDYEGARRFGARAAVLVPRLGNRDHLGVRAAQRPAELGWRACLAIMGTGMPILTRNFPDELTPVDLSRLPKRPKTLRRATIDT